MLSNMTTYRNDAQDPAIAWIKTARKDFEEFPLGARQDLARALTVVAEGGHPDIAKPLTGFGPAYWSWR